MSLHPVCLCIASAGKRNLKLYDISIDHRDTSSADILRKNRRTHIKNIKVISGIIHFQSKVS